MNMPDKVNLGFIVNQLDRLAVQRIDPAWLKERVEATDSRFLLFFGDRPVIDISGEPIRIKRFDHAHAEHLGGDQPPVLLGTGDDNVTLFAVRSTLAEPPPDWPEHYKLIDLRSLAMQGCTAGTRARPAGTGPLAAALA